MTATATKKPGRNGHAGANGDARIALAGHDAKSASFHLVAPARLVASRTNPRKTFDEDALRELADSIREVGVLEPILVREDRDWHAVPGQNGKVKGWWLENLRRQELICFHEDEGATRRCLPVYEVVAGERRLRAARLAGLAEVPCMVRDLNDRQALKIQVLENLQRSDLHFLEEADGFFQLIDGHGYTAEALAKELGKSKSWVYGALKLAALPERARAACRDGRLSRSVAQLLARIPSAALREEATDTILIDPDDDTDDGQGEVLTFREAKHLVESRFMVELKRARFPLDLADLVPAAGDCTGCPKRTGNNPEFQGSRADVCTDPDCFRAKGEAWKGRARLDAEAAGKKVLGEKEAAKLFPYGGHLAYGAPYVELTQTCYEDDGQRTYGEILGADSAPLEVLAFDKEGNPHTLIDRQAAESLLKVKGVIQGPTRVPAPAKAERDPAHEKQLFEDRVKAEKTKRLLAAAAAAGERHGQGCTSLLSLGPLLRVLAAGWLDEAWGETKTRVARRRGVEDLFKAAAAMAPAEVLGLLAELRAARLAAWSNDDKAGAEFWRALGIDVKRTEREVREELKAKAKKKGGKG